MPKHFTFFNETKYTFEGRKEGEEIILFLHKHWYTIANKIFGLFLLSLLPFLLVLIVGQYLLQYNLMAIFAVLWASYYLILWFFLFYTLTMYNLNNWIVTNMRIVDRHQLGFFKQEVAELNLLNVQDVSFKMNGLMATTMNYGCIEVQTAGRENKFSFDQIPNPEYVKDEITKIADTVKGHNGLYNNINEGAPATPAPIPVKLDPELDQS